uniref:Uncharacterized protein n=1 Tax=Entomoneis paludosa TaxID=265537 RepID=A0A6U3B2T9_9STRA|mmetsp:Transcript_26359/g.55096  ORF Transcript_26359/g.55096 Transcript_26359/m.55096 type:complete len:595 (+) Transcript_26359:69-1853(+)
MGNRQFKIAVSIDQEVCKAGQLVTGKVYLSIPRGTKGLSQFRGIHLLLNGTEHSVVAIKPGTIEYDQRKRSGKALIEKSAQTIVRADYPLVNLNGLKHGQYEYPFQLPLRDDLPGSIYCNLGSGEHSYCQIKYTLAAYIDHDGAPLPATQLRHEMSIKMKGAPSGPPGPAPISSQTELYPVTSCWLWKQGVISMGWRADRSVASPGDHIHVHCWGENQSRLKVEYISFQWIEHTQWRTESGNSNNSSTRNFSRILAEERQPIQGHQNWEAVKIPRTNHEALLQEHGSPTMLTTLTIPQDARDSYQGPLVEVKHSLLITVHTVGGMFSTTPESSSAVRITQRGAVSPSMSSSTATSEPVTAHATVVPAASAPSDFYDDNPSGPVMVQAEALPEDWTPVEADVVTLPLASAVVISDSVDVNPPITPLASAPDESLLFSSAASAAPDSKQMYGGSTAAAAAATPKSSLSASSTGTTGNVELDQLAQLAAECPENLAVVLEDPSWAERMRNLSPREYSQFVQAAGLGAAKSLAVGMGSSFQCKHVLACIWTLHDTSDRIRLLQDVAPLASDIRSKYAMIEEELSNEELTMFRSAVNHV